MKALERELKESLAVIAKKLGGKPRAGIILGSGLGGFVESLDHLKTLPYSQIPHFPASTAPGHAGRLCLGSVGHVGGVDVIAMQGRVHYYEGYPMERVTYPVRILAGLGVRSLIVTNASGGANPSFRPGDLVVLRDQINLMGASPLVGSASAAHNAASPPRAAHDETGASFARDLVDMSEPYDDEYSEIAMRAGMRLGLSMRRGVAGAVTGPSYETPAEVRMLRRLGADTVSMSTIPEVIVARSLGLRVLGIACVTNLAAGLSPTPLSHEEVLETTRRAADGFGRLLRAVLPELVA
ncbi:MAG: purine-nucleoside phosphorylase [bacterium]